MNKQLIKDLLPPALIKFLRMAGLVNNINWAGNYSRWEDAVTKSSGYDSNDILEKVKNALLKVKNGEAAYERDSILFDKMEYDWPIAASLMWVAAQDGYLHVMDFGGSLGSTYFQNQFFLKNINDLSWNIIEQPHYVQCGKAEFEDKQLKFYFDIKTCMEQNKINVILLSSVLPYLEQPHEFLKTIEKLEVKFILIDKMPLINSNTDRLTVQSVSAKICKASYPAWFFSKTKFYGFIEKHFQIVADFDREITANIPAIFKGLLLVKKQNNEFDKILH
jgi:putative methyltransferase (TIGR04325 family)